MTGKGGVRKWEGRCGKWKRGGVEGGKGGEGGKGDLEGGKWKLKVEGEVDV